MTKLKFYVRFFFAFALAFSLFSQPASAMTGNPIKRLLDFLQNYAENYISQQIYIQTDRNIYHSGEVIWFSGWILDAQNGLPDTMCRNLYVELIDFEKKRTDHVLLEVKNGYANGRFLLPKKKREGVYILRAYTRIMQNFSSGFLFSKPITIVNPYNYREFKVFSRKAIRKNKRKSRKPQIHFFPESGNIIADVENKIVFSATDFSGHKTEVEAKLYEKKKQKLIGSTTTKNGIGSFVFQAEKETDYYVEATGKNGKRKRFSIQSAKVESFLLSIKNNANSFEVQIVTARDVSADRNENELVLVAHKSGKVVWSEAITYKGKELHYSINKKVLTKGIIEFVLLDARLNVLGKRLIYNRKERNNLIVKSNKTAFSTREKVELEIDSEFDEMQNLSVSVSFFGDDAEIDLRRKNILSSLLVDASTENRLRLLPENVYTDDEYIDNLLIASQSSKVDFELINDTIRTPKHGRERAISINGRVERVMSFPAKGSVIKLSVLSEYYEPLKTKAKENGEFSFGDLNFYDTTTIFIEAKNKNGRKNMAIEVIDPKNPEIGYDFFYDTPLNISDKARAYLAEKSVADNEIDKYREHYIHADIMDEDSDLPPRTRIYDRADNVIVFDETNSHYSSLTEALRGKVPGMTLGSNSASLRGAGTMTGSSNPLVLIDGMPTDYSTLDAINPQDVDRVEILKSAGNTGIFGQRGANGVISVFTKRGYYVTGEIEFDTTGYQSFVKFVAPNYEKSKNLQTPDNRITLFWNPKLAIRHKQKTKISFFTSDIKGRFRVVIEGVSKTGKILFYEHYITVN